MGNFFDYMADAYEDPIKKEANILEKGVKDAYKTFRSDRKLSKEYEKMLEDRKKLMEQQNAMHETMRQIEQEKLNERMEKEAEYLRILEKKSAEYNQLTGTTGYALHEQYDRNNKDQQALDAYYSNKIQNVGEKDRGELNDWYAYGTEKIYNKTPAKDRLDQAYLKKFEGVAVDDFEMEAKINEWYEIASAIYEARGEMELFKFDFDAVKEIMKEGLKEIKKPLTDGLVNVIKGGSASEMINELGETLKNFAAQKSAHLLMEAGYETILGIGKAISPYTRHEAPLHFTAAAHYAAGAATMGAFVMGMAHAGIDDIPSEGTWLLDKGERVVDANTNKDLKSFINNGSQGTVVNVTINGGNQESVMEALPELEKIIVNTVSGNIMSGGQIKRTIQDYR